MATSGLTRSNSAPGTAKLSTSAWGWILFESGRVPHLLLVSAFVFVPYVVRSVIGDPVRGQELIALVSTWSGVLAAIVAPIIGAAVDCWGARKPLLGLIVAIQIALLGALWWAEPAGAGLSLEMILLLLGAITLLAGLNDLLFNSMMPQAIGRERAAKASGYALTIANVVGVVALIAVLIAFELPGKVPAGGLVPAQPLLGLDAATHETARIVGPLCAAILLVFSIPLFLVTEDSPRTGMGVVQSVAAGTRKLGALLRQAHRTHRNVGIFLLARIAFFDAIGAYVVFSGVYVTGVMGWHGPEMLIFGVGSAIFCGIGAYLAQLLDRGLGPKPALLIELGVLALCILGEIGMASDHILFVAHEPVASGRAIFSTTADLVFLGLAFGAATTLVAAAASSRTFLVRLVPPAEAGTIFGLAALSNAATNWITPLLIGIFTAAFGSQQSGFIPLLLLIGIGVLGLLFVQGPPSSSDHHDATNATP